MLNPQYSKLKSIKFVIFRIVSDSSPPVPLSDSGWKVNYFISNLPHNLDILQIIRNIYNIYSEILINPCYFADFFNILSDFTLLYCEICEFQINP